MSVLSGLEKDGNHAYKKSAHHHEKLWHYHEKLEEYESHWKQLWNLTGIYRKLPEISIQITRNYRKLLEITGK